MIRKSAQYDQAIQLRRRGFTYVEIAKIVDVSKSTISLWLSRETWSQKVTEENARRSAKENSKRISLLNTVRGNQYKKLYAEAERSAITEYKHYKANPLFVAGLALYAGMGDLDVSHPIRLTTSRKDVQLLFIKFTHEYLGVPREKIRFWLLLYPAHKPLVCTRAWSKAVRLPVSQFHRYQIIENKKKTNTLHDGVGNTIIGGTVLKKKLMKWVELVQKEL